MKLIASLFLLFFLGGLFAQTTAPGLVTRAETIKNNLYLTVCVDPQGSRCQIFKVCNYEGWIVGDWYTFPLNRFLIGDRNSPYKRFIDTNPQWMRPLWDCEPAPSLTPMSLSVWPEKLFVSPAHEKSWRLYELEKKKTKPPTTRKKPPRKDPGMTLK